MADSVGEKLKKLRNSLDLSQQIVADGANITKSSLSRIESGERLPSFEALRGLCQVYGVSADYFLDLDFEITSLADSLAIEAKKCSAAFELEEMAEFYGEEAQESVKRLQDLLQDYFHIRGLENG
jgi:transcriptional regulator with XRE-family HTH domain